MRGRLWWWIVGAGLVVGCASVAPTPQGGIGSREPASAAREAAATEPEFVPSLAIHWVRDSVEYRAAAIQTYRLAAAEVERLAGVLTPGRWAVVLDGDETVLDNSLFQKELEMNGETFTPELWTAWVARKEAPPVPGSLAFLATVHARGGKIAIVTNRAAGECADTEEDLRRFEIPYDLILCRPASGERDKAPRWAAIEAGTASPDLPALEIVMYVGDTSRDFPGVVQSRREGPESALDDFGSLFFILPNPMYGSSWVGNPPR